MIMIINKLIALLPNPRQEVFHTRPMAFRGIDPVPMWIVPDWFAVLLERIDS
jgi:hypothetical protein